MIDKRLILKSCVVHKGKKYICFTDFKKYATFDELKSALIAKFKKDGVSNGVMRIYTSTKFRKKKYDADFYKNIKNENFDKLLFKFIYF